MAIKDKATLAAEIASEFPDNAAGEITAAVLRGYLTDILDSKLLQITQYVILNMVENWVADNIDENIRYLGNQVVTIQLPPADASLVGRTTTLLTTTTDKLSFIPDGSDTIDGDATSSQPAQITVACTGVGTWAVTHLPLKNVIALANMGGGFVIDQTDPDDPVINPDFGFATDSETNADVPDSWTTLAELATVDTVVGAHYMITVTIAYNIDSTNNAVGFRLTGDIVTQEFMKESKDSSDVVPLSYSIPYTAAAATTSIDVEMKKSSPGNTLDVSYCTITMQRIG